MVKFFTNSKMFLILNLIIAIFVSNTPASGFFNRIKPAALAEKISRTHVLLGTAYLAKKEYKSAHYEFEQALKVWPEIRNREKHLADYYCEFAKVEYGYGDMEKACRLFKKALWIDEENIRAKAGLAIVYQAWAEQQDEEDILKASHYQHRALMMVDTIDMERAFYKLTYKPVRISGFMHIKLNFADTYCNLASSYFKARKFKRAKHYYQQALAICPECQEALEGLAKIENR